MKGVEVREKFEVFEVYTSVFNSDKGLLASLKGKGWHSNPILLEIFPNFKQFSLKNIFNISKFSKFLPLIFFNILQIFLEIFSSIF